MTDSKDAPPPVIPVDAKPAPARRGRLGLCAACNEPVAGHFDTQGHFIGCVAAEPDTVFVLWPHSGRVVDPAVIGRQRALVAAAAEPTDAPPTTHEPKHKRRGAYLRHMPTPEAYHYNVTDLTPNRREALKALLAVHKRTKAGAFMTDLEARSGLPQNKLSEALRWLERKGLNAPIPERNPPPSKK